MSDYHNMINNLNRKLFFKLNKVRIVPDEEKGEEKTIGEFVGGMGFAQHYGGNSHSTYDTRDVTQNDREYSTHKPLALKSDHPIKRRREIECPDDDPSCKDHEEEKNTGGIVINLDKAKGGIGEQKLPDYITNVRITGKVPPAKKRYIQANMEKWWREVERRERTTMEPLSVHFTPKTTYLYLGVLGLSSKNAVEVTVYNGRVKDYRLVSRMDIKEQDEAVPDAPAPEPEPTATEDPSPDEMGAEGDMADVDDMGDPGMGGAGADMSDPGLGDPNQMMPGEEPPKDPSELGRTYEMKKIYARLVSMNEYLADERSPRIVKTKQSIAKAIDLFAVIGANPESYKETIDEIIISYYKFLEAAYRRVKAFYKGEAQRVGGLPKNEEQKSDESTEVTI